MLSKTVSVNFQCQYGPWTLIPIIYLYHFLCWYLTSNYCSQIRASNLAYSDSSPCLIFSAIIERRDKCMDAEQ